MGSAGEEMTESRTASFGQRNRASEAHAGGGLWPFTPDSGPTLVGLPSRAEGWKVTPKQLRGTPM